MTVTQNSTLKFKRHPYPRDGYTKNYRCFISECGNYLLVEGSEVYYKPNGISDYRPDRKLEIWARVDEGEGWPVYDEAYRRKITSLPYHYVCDVEEAIAYIERWEKTRKYALIPDKEAAIPLRDWWQQKDRFANPLPSFFVGSCGQCGVGYDLFLVSFRYEESNRLDSKIMCKRCMT